MFLDYGTSSKNYFNTQIFKDIKYYGKEQLRQKCLSAYSEVLDAKNERELKPLQILKLFSYFISLNYTYVNEEVPKLDINPNPQKYRELVERFEKLQKYCESNNFINVLDMLEGIKFILDDIFFDIRFSNADLVSLLETAIKKRKKMDSEIFRIVNSRGDDLDFLEIDYYNNHIIIDTKKKYYKDNEMIIKDTLLKTFKDILNLKIESVSLKYNAEIEHLHGYRRDKIDCQEEDVKIKIIPKGYPKTGFFIDNRQIRKYLKENSINKKILNLCSFTCTLGAIARMSGAEQVINLDREEKYLTLGKEIYEENGIEYDEREFVPKNIDIFFEKTDGQSYDIVILDLAEIASIPCNFSNMENKYDNYNRKALELLNKDGILITSCCSHGFSRERFKKILDDIIEDGNYEIINNFSFDELDDHPVKANDNYSDYLKIYGIRKKN